MTKKIGISLRDELYEWALGEVEQGRAESVSALIAEGLEIIEARTQLETLVTDLRADIGDLDEPTRQQVAAALRAADAAYAKHLVGRAGTAA